MPNPAEASSSRARPGPVEAAQLLELPSDVQLGADAVERVHDGQRVARPGGRLLDHTGLEGTGRRVEDGEAGDRLAVHGVELAADEHRAGRRIGLQGQHAARVELGTRGRGDGGRECRAPRARGGVDREQVRLRHDRASGHGHDLGELTTHVHGVAESGQRPHAQVLGGVRDPRRRGRKTELGADRRDP